MKVGIEKITRYNGASLTRDELFALRELPATAIDPGVDGAVAWRTSMGHARFDGLGNWDNVSAHCRHGLGPALVLLEDQFLGKSFRATAETIWQAAALVGYLANDFAKDGLVVVHVMPATWQTVQAKRMQYTPKGKRLTRDEGIALALSEVALSKVRLPKANKKQKEGFASAYGILRWWEEQCSSL